MAYIYELVVTLKNASAILISKLKDQKNGNI